MQPLALELTQPRLTNRWEPLRPHLLQSAYYHSPHRFNVLPAGRRSGKTELAKRKLVRRAIRGSGFRSPRYFAAAPTRDQAKTIYWKDLKALVPRKLIGDISETHLSIMLTTGAELFVVGMDKPERIEGSPVDGGILDEYANMKPDAWEAHVFPALADRGGWCDMIGVPEGRNHYFALYNRAMADMAALGPASEWGAYTWTSASVLNGTAIGRAFLAEAQRTMALRTYRQEFEASFESFTGVILYAFTRENVRPCPYDPRLNIHVGQDFNVNPMSATVWQERPLFINGMPVIINGRPDVVSDQIGEVVLMTSNTDEAADEITRRYARNGQVNHITFHPDPSGANNHTSAQGRTDISILVSRGFNVQAMTSAPLIRDRFAVTNARFRNAKGERRQFVDPSCTASIEAYEGLVYKVGKDGLSTNDPDKTGGFDHLCDAAGYYDYGRFAYVPPHRIQVPLIGR
jgi:hypothetical protein